MNIERMVEMANDISNFFAADPDHAAAVAGVAGHIKRYWEARMIRQMLVHLDAGGHGLGDLAREGLQEIARMQKAAA